MYAKNTLSRMTKLIFNVSKDITSPRKQLHDVYLLNLMYTLRKPLQERSYT